MRDTIRDGGVAFERTHGTGLYDFLARHPAAAKRYDAAIDSFTRHEAALLCEKFDFAGMETVVDVGGGRGTLLLEILRRWPQLQGVLFDLTHVAEEVRARLQQEAPGRVEDVGGDFMDSVPEGADLYLIKHVLHNWSDEQASTLLLNCAKARRRGGRILVVEAILAPDARPNMARMLELEMHVLTGGHERRKPEFRRLFRSAGLSLERLEPLTPTAWLLIGV
jgi:cyclopropane fatty-acyl-phospholipid synthase-like methyltransferase